ncbi:hypothetical protein Glove_564g2 [Diversispora epigaea]|uniref:Uncharacterized protein n=1 Tax=Diversispora epigaea TaxID=1348612 RepID=A0A397GE42_9GLOM|nr:hypothetical protein Glove_564g2 [Diversispora epigaea]
MMNHIKLTLEDAKQIATSKTWRSHCAEMSFQVKYFINDAHRITKSRGEQYLSNSFINSIMPLQWRYAKNHKWITRFSHIKDGNGHYTIEDARQMACNKNGECLSSKYINNSTKLQWRCIKGHE